jgi:hypothetical protein
MREYDGGPKNKVRRKCSVRIHFIAKWREIGKNSDSIYTSMQKMASLRIEKAQERVKE